MSVRLQAMVGAVLLAVGLAAPAWAEERPADRRTEIAAVIDRWAEARVKGDSAFLERFYGAELRIGQMNGGIVERRDDIALFAARAIKPEYIRDTDLDIHVYGDVAVVGAVESLKGTYRGTPGEMSLRMLNVLVHRDGRWQLVASQSAPIAK